MPDCVLKASSSLALSFLSGSGAYLTYTEELGTLSLKFEIEGDDFPLAIACIMGLKIPLYKTHQL